MTSILENMKILLSASKFSNTETVGDEFDIGNNQFFTLKKSPILSHQHHCNRCEIREAVLICSLSYIDYRSESPDYEKTAAYWENIFARAIFFIIFEVSLLAYFIMYNLNEIFSTVS